MAGSIATAYVQVIPSMSGVKSKLTSEFGGAGESAGSLFESSFTEKASNIISSVTKIGAAAVTAATTALAALATESISNYSSYEQLTGGIEKIFEDMDTSVIMEDANNAWKNLNMSANDYMETIVDVGATFSATMGDEAGYEAAKTGFQAISDYASGTGKDIDTLSEKFTLISRSTSSYQSIADQFSGILPATSSAFLEQAQAAGFLEESYKSLTDVPIAEYQEALSLMLEQGVEDLNLAGNTAMETENTISGSLAAVKATWENLVTSFADSEQDLGTYLDNFINSVVTAKDNIVPVIKQMLPRITEGIQTLIEELGPELASAMEEILPYLIEGAAKLVADLIVALPGILATFAVALKNALVESLDEAGLSEVGDKVEEIFDWIVSNKEGIIGALTAIGVAIAAVFVVNTISSFASALSMLTSPVGLAVAAFTMLYVACEPFRDIINQIIGYIAEVIAELPTLFAGIKENVASDMEELGQLFSSAWDSIITAFDAAVEWLYQGVLSISSFFVVTIPQAVTSAATSFASFLEQLITIFNQIISKVASWAVEMGQKATSAASEFVSKLVSGLSSLPSKMYTVGSNIISGIWNGISAGWSWLSSKVSELASSLYESAKSALGINSPSKTFRDQIGRWIPAGIAEGVKKYAGLATSAINDLAVGTKAEFTAALRVNSNGNGRSGENAAAGSRTVNIIQNIYSQAQTAADLMNEARYKAETGVLLGV